MSYNKYFNFVVIDDDTRIFKFRKSYSLLTLSEVIDTIKRVAGREVDRILWMGSSLGEVVLQNSNMSYLWNEWCKIDTIRIRLEPKKNKENIDSAKSKMLTKFSFVVNDGDARIVKFIRAYSSLTLYGIWEVLDANLGRQVDSFYSEGGGIHATRGYLSGDCASRMINSWRAESGAIRLRVLNLYNHPTCTKLKEEELEQRAEPRMEIIPEYSRNKKPEFMMTKKEQEFKILADNLSPKEMMKKIVDDNNYDLLFYLYNSSKYELDGEYNELDSEYNVNVDNNWALYEACDRGLCTILRLLLQFKCIDPLDEDCGCPLEAACTNGHERVVHILLAWRGIKGETMDVNSSDALEGACKEGHESIVKILLDHPDIDLPSNVLRRAYDGEEWDIVQLLLNWSRTGKDGKVERVNVKEGYDSILMKCIHDNKIDFVEQILSRSDVYLPMRYIRAINCSSQMLSILLDWRGEDGDYWDISNYDARGLNGDQLGVFLDWRGPNGEKIDTMKNEKFDMENNDVMRALSKRRRFTFDEEEYCVLKRTKCECVHADCEVVKFECRPFMNE